MAISPAAPALVTAFLGCAAAAIVSGCERHISSQNIDVANKLQEAAQLRKPKWTGVNEGMTEKEVESILGEPVRRHQGKTVEIMQPVQVPTLTYVYQQDGQTMELSFLDGKLQGRVPNFGEKLDPKAPLHMKKAPEKSAANGDTKPAASPVNTGAAAAPGTAQPPKEQP